MQIKRKKKVAVSDKVQLKAISKIKPYKKGNFIFMGAVMKTELF